MSTGKTNAYSWTQTKDSMSVQIPTGSSSTGKGDVDVSVSKTALSVRLRTGKVLCNGSFADGTSVDASESVWYVDSGGIVVVDLFKSRTGWWTRLLEGDESEDISALLKADEEEQKLGKRPQPEMRPIGKLGEQTANEETFKGSSSFEW